MTHSDSDKINNVTTLYSDREHLNCTAPLTNQNSN